MLLNPFRILYELFVFALQAAFLYGLALIAAITFIAWMIAEHREPTIVKEYVTVPVIEYVTVAVAVAEEVEEIKNECLQIAGCRVFYENGKEICPECVKK
jgi:hypothetical protein